MSAGNVTARVSHANGGTSGEGSIESGNATAVRVPAALPAASGAYHGSGGNSNGGNTGAVNWRNTGSANGGNTGSATAEHG